MAFHFGDGWDVGTIEAFYDPPKVKHGYNVDVYYPQQKRTRYHALELDAYGTGEEFGAPLASWFFLRTPEQPLRRRKRQKNS